MIKHYWSNIWDTKQTMFDRLSTSRFIAWPAERAWQCFWKTSKTISDCCRQRCLANNVLWCGQTIKNFVGKANFRCLLNNVWSFGQGLRTCFGTLISRKHVLLWNFLWLSMSLFRKNITLKFSFRTFSKSVARISRSCRIGSKWTWRRDLGFIKKRENSSILRYLQ